MEQWLRDALAEEQGYTICPLVLESYIHCDKKCKSCAINIEFEKGMRESVENGKNG